MRLILAVLALLLVAGCSSEPATTTSTITIETVPTTTTTSTSSTTTTTVITYFGSAAEVEALEGLDQALEMLSEPDCEGALLRLNGSRDVFHRLFDQAMADKADKLTKARLLTDIQRANELEERIIEFCEARKKPVPTTLAMPDITVPITQPDMTKVTIPVTSRYDIRYEADGCVNLWPVLEKISYSENGIVKIELSPNVYMNSIDLYGKDGGCDDVKWDLRGSIIFLTAKCEPIDEDKPFVLRMEYSYFEGINEEAKRICKIRRLIDWKGMDQNHLLRNY